MFRFAVVFGLLGVLLGATEVGGAHAASVRHYHGRTVPCPHQPKHRCHRHRVVLYCHVPVRES